MTCCFSQADVTHLLFNGFTYFFMARPVLAMLGNRQFMILYLGGESAQRILFCTISLLVTCRWSDRKHDKCALEPRSTSLFIPWCQWYVQLARTPKFRFTDKKLKGAIYAIMTYFACCEPFAKFLLFAIVPIPAWMFIPGVLLYDVYEMVASNRVRIYITLKPWLYGCIGLYCCR